MKPRQRFVRLSALLAALLLLLPLLSFPAKAVTVDQVVSKIRSSLKWDSSARYCYDMAGVLSRQTEQDLIKNGSALDEANSGQLLVVTVDNLSGAEQAYFATKLFNELGLGSSERDDGVLLLLIKEGPHCQITTGDGIADVLTDRRCGEILDKYCVPNLKAGNYDLAATETGRAIRSYMKSREIDPSTTRSSKSNSTVNYVINGVIGLWLLMLAASIVCQLLDYVVRGFRRIRYRTPSETPTRLHAAASFIFVNLFLKPVWWLVKMIFYAIISGGSSSSDRSSGGGGSSSGGGGSSSGGGAGR